MIKILPGIFENYKSRFGMLTMLSLLSGSYSATAQYCNETEWDGEYEYITNVNFAGIDNPTEDFYGLAQDFTSIGSANVNIGETYPISVSIEVDEYDSIDVFFDWNQNGVFDDPGEVYVVVEDAMTSGTYTMDITVPQDAVLGTTQMRVMIVYDRAYEGPDPCTSYWEYGEVEDYAVTVADALQTSNFDMSAFAAYPNPAQDMLNIDYNSVISEVKIYNLLGQEVLAQTMADTNFRMNIGTLASGSYIVKLFGHNSQHSFKLIKN